MKAMRISVLLFSAILLLGLAESVHALPFDESFFESFGEPTTFKSKNSAFKFESSLVENESLIPNDWKVEATLEGGFATSSIVKADNTDKIEGAFTYFELTADVDNDQLFNFYGVLEQSGLTLGTLDPHNPWFIHGYFVSDGNSGYSEFKAYISNIDPHEIGSVPEPATMMLVATGMLGMAAIRRRRKE